MSKFNTFLVAIGMVFLALTTNAQLTFTFVPSNSAPDLGETITVDVVVSDFTDIASYQYSIDWNQSYLSYQGVSNFNLTGLSAGSFGTTQTGNGILTTSWSDPFAASQSVANGTSLFTITFDVVATSGANTSIDFSQSPLGFEVIQDQGGSLVDITDPMNMFIDAPIVIAGGGGGGGAIPCSFAGFGLTVSSDSAATGEQVCLDVAACNFTDIISVQYTTQFDPNLLQFDEVNSFNLANLSAGNFGTNNAGNGFITMSWFDSLGAGITIPDETVIYSICFTAIGAGGEMDDVLINGALSPIEVTDASSGGSNIGLESVDGVVEITGTSGSAVTLIASQQTGSPGDTITIDISVRNFDSIVSMQGSMLWTPTIINFYEVISAGNLPTNPTYNTSSVLTDAGKLTFSWDDPTTNGVSLADDEIIFSVRYIIDAGAAAGSETAIDFTNDPTPVEITQIINGSIEAVPLAKIPGLVDVVGEGLLTLTIGDVIGAQGDTVCVPVTVENFNGVVSMEYDVIWDDTELDYINVQDFNLSALGSGNFNPVSSTKLKLSWFEPLLDPQTLPDGDTLYTMCFEILAVDGITAIISFDTTGNIEITDGTNPLPNNVIDGGVTVEDNGPPIEVSDTTITDVLCNGDLTGAINIEVINDVGTVTYAWSNGPATQDISGVGAGTYTVTISDDVNTITESYTITEPTAALSQMTSDTDITCNGDDDGEATVTPSGGTAPYIYAWDGGTNPTTATITNLSPDTYNVTVTDDNGCTVTASVTITEPAVLTQTTSDTDITCNGDDDGEATVTPSGGTSPYTYAWDGGTNPTTATITDLSPDTYNVTVTDDNDCTVTASVTITEPSGLSVSMSAMDATSNGGSNGEATAAPSGGTSPYTYVWSVPGTTATITGLTAGTYTVTVTDDNDCTIVDMVTVGEPGAMSASISGTDLSCNGADDGEATATPAGGVAPYDYEWDPASAGTTATVTGLAPGTYNVTITDDNGTTATANVMITEPTVLTVNVTDDNVTCNGADDGTATANPAGGTAPYDYEWSANAGSATTAMITGLAPDTYTVTITDDNGCTTTGSTGVSEPAVLTLPGSVTHESALGAEDGAITVTPTGGTPGYVYEWSSPPGGNTATISGLAPGSYTVTVMDGFDCTVVETFTVNEFDAPEITVVEVINVECNGGNTGSIEISVSGGLAPYTYNWNPGGANDEIRTNLIAGNYTVTVTDDNGTTAVETITVSQESAIVITLDGQINIDCNNDNTGSATITVTGGTAPYTYNWGAGGSNEDPTNLPAGDYVPTITDDNGCVQVGPIITITEPTPINISVVSSSNVSCNGADDGMIDIMVTGGTTPYAYSWGSGGTNEDPTNLPAGTYTVTITDANGCVQVGPAVMITEPDALIASHTSTPVSCNGANDGTIDLTVSGGAMPYSYAWTGGLSDQEDHTGVAAGTYFVTVTDLLGCTVVEGLVAITQPALLTVSNTVTNASAANDDGAIDITVLGGTAPYSYEWNNGETTEDLNGISSGCYTVTIEDTNGCSVVDSIKVGGIIVLTEVITDVSCAGSCDGAIDITVIGGIAPYTYNWAGIGTTPGAQDQDGLCAGNYGVTVSDSNGSLTAGTFTIGTPTALTITNTDIQHETGNGCNGSINVTITGGTLPYTYQWSNGETSEDVTNLCKGDYNVTVVDANGCVLISPTLTVLPPPLVVAMSSMDMVLCNGGDDGEICFSVLGGCAPYTVTVDGQMQTSVDGNNICFSNLTAGDYNIIIQDSGTPQMNLLFPFEITEPEAIVLTYEVINNTDPTGLNCNGAIDLTVMGGTAPYTYQWSNGVDFEDPINLCESPPAYSCTVTDANGCIQIVNGIIVELGLNIEVISAEDVSCFDACDGSINIEVFGGEEPYTYIWGPTGQTTPNVNNLCADTYTVTITDNTGNTATTTVTINQPSAAWAVTVDNTVRPTNNDANGLIELSVSGGWGFESVTWTGPNGFTGNALTIGGLVEGFYTATVTDANGCIEVIIVNLIAYRLDLDFEFMEPDCNGEVNGEIELFISGGSGDYSVTWDNGQSGTVIFSISAGDYTVTVVDNIITGLTTTETVTLGQPDVLLVTLTGTNPTGPADGSITSEVSGGTAPYIYIWNTDAGDVTPGVNRLPAGTYAVVVTDDHGCVQIEEIELVIQGECLEARKVISPNNDGKNDELIISCVEGLDNNLRIFNRWGQMVYEADNYDNSWMGTEQDGTTLLPESGYFWVLEYQEDGQTKQLKGAFTLLRDQN